MDTNKSTQETNGTTPASGAVTQTQTTEPANPEPAAAQTQTTEPKPAQPADNSQQPADKQDNKKEPATPEFNLKPEDYGNFGIDESQPINKDLSDALKEFGIANKVSKEAMNGLVKKYTDISTALIEKHNNDFNEIKKGWEQQNADTYKTEVENVYKKIDGFLTSSDAGKEMKKFLDENGIAKNSSVVNFLYSLSKDYAEDNTLRGNTTGDVKQKSDYEILYPDDK
jgi:hypothetical protein